MIAFIEKYFKRRRSKKIISQFINNYSYLVTPTYDYQLDEIGKLIEYFGRYGNFIYNDILSKDSDASIENLPEHIIIKMDIYNKYGGDI